MNFGQNQYKKEAQLNSEFIKNNTWQGETLLYKKYITAVVVWSLPWLLLLSNCQNIIDSYFLLLLYYIAYYYFICCCFLLLLLHYFHFVFRNIMFRRLDLDFHQGMRLKFLKYILYIWNMALFCNGYGVALIPIPT